jgi:hypothetical protein
MLSCVSCLRRIGIPFFPSTLFIYHCRRWLKVVLVLPFTCFHGLRKFNRLFHLI